MADDKLSPIKNWDDLIERFGGPTAFGAVIGVLRQTAHDMKKRGFVKSNYWHTIVAEAKKRGWSDIDYEMLGELAANHPPGNGN